MYKHIFYIIILFCISCQYTKKDGVIEYTPKDTFTVSLNVVDEKKFRIASGLRFSYITTQNSDQDNKSHG